MATATACIDRDQVESYLEESLSEAARASLQRHLAECRSCQQRVESYPPDDSLTGTLASCGPNPRVEYPPVVRDLILRVQGTLATACGSGTPLPGQLADQIERLSRPADGTPIPSARFAFLEPAQQPDEIGRLGHYRILRVLGEGGMGVVFLAEDTILPRKVAIKVMRPEAAANPEAAARFRKEASHAVQAQHANVLTIFEVNEANGVPFIVMAYVAGQSLEERLRANPALSTRQMVRILRQIALGLAAAADKGIVHRDLKPANVLLEGPDEDAKLADFGLAREVTGSEQVTHSGMVLGTPAYMAPEQADGQRADERSDLFSFGCIAARAFLGHSPFEAATPLASLAALARYDEPKPFARNRPDLPPALGHLVDRLLQKNPDKRPTSAHAVAQELERIERALSPSEEAATAELPRRSGKGVLVAEADDAKTAVAIKGRRVAARWVIAAAVLLALLPLGYFFGPAVIRIVTNKGVLVVESDDASIEVNIKGERVTIVDANSKREFALAAGEDHEIEVRQLPDGIVVATRKFRLERNGKEILKATLAPEPAKFKVGFNVTSPMLANHDRDFTLTRLRDGRVLATGGKEGHNGATIEAAEIWDPRTGTWSATGSMKVARDRHSATLLPDGRVLVAGGHGPGDRLASAEIYDPDAGTWSFTAKMATAREGHTAILLKSGKVLVVAGGFGKGNETFGLDSAELYDPTKGSWSPTGALKEARMNAQGVLLPDGRVLMAGGRDQGVTFKNLVSAEIYDPVTGAWSPTGSMHVGRRHSFTLTTLPTGKVLVAGGATDWLPGSVTDKVELWDPATGKWTAASPLPTPRMEHTATLLANGSILVTGGDEPAKAGMGASLNTAVVYKPATQTWSPTTNTLGEPRGGHQAVSLLDGSVLLLGGRNGLRPLRSAELFRPAE